MPNNVNNVSVGKPATSGVVFRADAGTELPQGANTSLAEAYKNMGYISDEGITKSTKRESDKIKAYGGDVVATPQTEFSDEFKTTFLEALNVDTIKAVYGSENVSGDLESGIAITVNAKELPEGVWVFDQVLKGGTLYRMVVPIGKITEVGDVKFVDGEAIGHEVTISALPDTRGNTHYEYMKKP